MSEKAVPALMLRGYPELPAPVLELAPVPVSQGLVAPVQVQVQVRVRESVQVRESALVLPVFPLPGESLLVVLI